VWSEAASELGQRSAGKRSFERRDVVPLQWNQPPEFFQKTRIPHRFAEDGATSGSQDTADFAHRTVEIEMVQDSIAENDINGCGGEWDGVGGSHEKARAVGQVVGREPPARRVNQGFTNIERPDVCATIRQTNGIRSAPAAEIEHRLAGHVAEEIVGVLERVRCVSRWRVIRLKAGEGEAEDDAGERDGVFRAANNLSPFPSRQIGCISARGH
jgi:hypothetical protein